MTQPGLGIEELKKAGLLDVGTEGTRALAKHIPRCTAVRPRGAQAESFRRMVALGRLRGNVVIGGEKIDGKRERELIAEREGWKA